MPYRARAHPPAAHRKAPGEFVQTAQSMMTLIRSDLVTTVLWPQDPLVKLPRPQTSPEAGQGMVVGQDEGCVIV